jgi:pimeloyl-ACP methyl ester carboxylesterase
MGQQAETLKSVWTEVGGLRMHARVALDEAPPGAPVVVLVHGLVVSSRYMLPFARLLARHARVYAPDLPGFGKSEHPPQPLDIAGLADALAGWMQAIGLERAPLIGNSLGCQVIADLALRYPQHVERAVLVGPTIDRHGRNLLEQTRRLLAATPWEDASLIGVQLRDTWDAGLRETLSTARYALADQIEAKLPALPMPVLVVAGAGDPLAPPSWAQELARLLPRGQLRLLPGAGHALNYSAPEGLLKLVLPFLNDYPALGATHN